MATPVTRILLTWKTRIDFTLIFVVPAENIDATHVVTLSAGDLGTMSKNNLRGITLGISTKWGINSLTLHPPLPGFIVM